MNFKDMSVYRDGRLDSRVAQTWLNDYKQMVMTNIVYRQSNPDTVPSEVLDAVYNGSPQTAEIVADTIIGWLNSHVGRCFIRDAFGVDIPTHDPEGTF